MNSSSKVMYYSANVNMHRYVLETRPAGKCCLYAVICAVLHLAFSITNEKSAEKKQYKYRENSKLDSKLGYTIVSWSEAVRYFPFLVGDGGRYCTDSESDTKENRQKIKLKN